MLIEIFIIFLLILCEGFFSGSEIAFLSAPRSVISALAQKGDRRAKLVLKEWEHIETVIATSIAGTTACVVVASTIGAHLLYRMFGPGYEFLTGIVLSPFIIVLGEIIPKDIASRYAVTVTLNTVYILKFLSYLLYPLVLLVRGVEKVLGQEASTETLRMERREIYDAIEFVHRGGGITVTEKRMSQALMAMSEKPLKEAMKPLVQVKAVEKNEPVKKALKIASKHGHSKIPVFSQRIINIIGYIKVTEVYRQASDETEPVEKYVKNILYFPETMPCDAALFSLAEKNEEIAAVVDEFGGAVGIVTTLDLLEEFIGRLEESDTPLISVKGSSYIISGLAELDEVEAKLGIKFPEDRESVTIGGFITEIMEKIPAKGEEIVWGGYRWKVLASDGKRIEKLEVKKVE